MGFESGGGDGGFRGHFLAGHDSFVVGAWTGFVAGEETKTMVVAARQTEVGLERYEFQNLGRVG